MKRVSLSALIGLTLASLVACGGDPTTPNPSGPTPPNVSVNAVTVTSVVMSASNIQLRANASLSDGSSRDVTGSSTWQSSDSTIATISSSGMLTVVGSGAVDARATYQSTTGSLRLVVAKPVDPATHFALSGVVREAQPNSRLLRDARIQITSGPEAGTFVMSDANGVFTFPSLSRGAISLEATMDGFLVWKLSNLSVDADRVIEVDLFPKPPTNAAGESASARCKDGTWSWASTLNDA